MFAPRVITMIGPKFARVFAGRIGRVSSCSGARDPLRSTWTSAARIVAVCTATPGFPSRIIGPEAVAPITVASTGAR